SPGTNTRFPQSNRYSGSRCETGCPDTGSRVPRQTALPRRPALAIAPCLPLPTPKAETQPAALVQLLERASCARSPVKLAPPALQYLTPQSDMKDCWSHSGAGAQA